VRKSEKERTSQTFLYSIKRNTKEFFILFGVIFMKVQPIQEIVKKFPGEWVLIHILEMDEETTTPILGELLAHVKKNEYIYEISSNYEGTEDLLVEYSPAPEDNELIVIV